MPPNGRNREKSDNKDCKETIHSGHFMVSDIDDSENHDDDESPSLAVHESDCDQDTAPSQVQGFDFETACRETLKTYTFGPRSSQSISIDASLTKLFECMTLAYSGRLTSPRWKQFKGLKLRLKDKIRLNNIIWRAWHIQFVLRRKQVVCQFTSPLEGDCYHRAESLLIEGKCWKHQISTVATEYQKWRLYCKDKLRKRSTDSESMAVDFDSKWGPWSNFNSLSSGSGTIDDDFFMDFNDTLFSTLIPNQPFDFPNPREIAARAGLADFIQPGLVQLQPAFDDFMDTFEPLQDFLSYRLAPLPEETSEQSQMQDVLSPSSPQQDFASAAPEANSFPLQNMLSSSVTGATSERSGTSVDSLYKSSKQTQKEQLEQTSHSERMIVETLIDSHLNTAPFQSSGQSPSLSHNSVPPQVPGSLHRNHVQVSHASPIAPVSSTENITLVSLPEPCIQNKLPVERTSSPLVSFQMPLVGHIPNHRADQTTNFIHSSILPTVQCHSPQVNQVSLGTTSVVPAQVPLTSLSQPHPIVPAPKTSKINKLQGVFLTLEASPQTLPPSNHGSASSPFTIPVHMANAIPPQLPLTTQSHIGMTSLQPQIVSSVKSESAKRDFNSVCGGIMVTKCSGNNSIRDQSPFRRHSYTGQQTQAYALQQTLEGSRRNRAGGTHILPAATQCSSHGGVFVVPEVPNKQRVRSRSVSSPQSGSPKTFTQSPSQAVSLTNISVSPPPVPQVTVAPIVRSTLCGSPTVLTAGGASVLPGAPSPPSNTTVIPPNTVLAQLLAGSQDRGTPTPVTTTTASANATSPTVAIISSIPALVTTTQTFVLSPVSLATVAGVNDFQRGLLMGAANQCFGTQNSSQCVLPSVSPSSPSSSATGSSSPALGNTPSEGSVSSQVKPFRPKSDEERIQYKEHRRVCHINAEQKRRCNIKNGFEALRHLLPSLNQNPNAKVSKAAMLQKAAEYIRTLKAERQQQQDEAEMLRQQIEGLNQSISVYQNQLPATGAPVPCQRTNRMKEMYEEYVRQQTLQNWKFWIFSLLMEPLLESYNNTVSTGSLDELCKMVLAWLDQHCSLMALRPGVLNSLKHLSTTTNILSDPSRMPEEATRAVTKKEVLRQ